MPTLHLLHTVPALPARLGPLVEAALPGWTIEHRVDEELLAATIREGRLTGATERRLAAHLAEMAQTADSVLVTCSTLGEAVDQLAPRVPVPVFRIDRGMAEEAVQRGARIGVLATLPTTLGPTGRLIRDTAAGAGIAVTVRDHLCEGAFARLQAGDREGHDAQVRAGFEMLAPEVEVIVLAQASMAAALPAEASDIVPVLTSPEPGIAAVARALADRFPA